MVRRLYSLAAVGVLTLSVWGCAAKPPEKPDLPSPSPSVPAGMKEVSRLPGHNESVKEASKGSADTDVKTVSKDGSAKSDMSDTVSKPESDVNAKNSSAKSGTATDASKDGQTQTASSAKADDYQTVTVPTLTSRGEHPWTLDAEKVQYSEDNQRVRVSAIVWSLLDENDKPRLTVRGRAADVNVESQNVVFDGPVDAVGSAGEQMHVNRLVWDSTKQKIFGTHGVRVVRKGSVMTGDNLTASPDLKHVEVSGNVHVNFIPTEVVKE